MGLIAITAVILLLAGCGKGESNPPSDNGANESLAAMSWEKMPQMAIELDKTYLANVRTSKGEFTIQLFAAESPVTVNNFIFLAEAGFYDNMSFHRIIESYMIQTGDAKGDGSGNPGYKIPDELSTTLKYEIGTVAMFNAGRPNTGGSQFFICVGEDAVNLNQAPNYTIFGKIMRGMDVVQSIAKMPTNNDIPLEAVMIESIDIEEQI